MEMTQDVTLTALIDQTQERLRQGWTQGYFARNAEGEQRGFDAADATCWCLVGATSRAYLDLTKDKTYRESCTWHTLRGRLLEKVREKTGCPTCHIANFNDDASNGLEDVLAVLDEVRESA